MKLDLFGGIIRAGQQALKIDGVELAKQLATQATAQFSRPLVSEAFQKMKVAGRNTLADKLEKVAAHLRKGECDAASVVVADIVDDIKF